MAARDKIKTAEALQEACSAERKLGRCIVFTNGCFDILHAGHVRYLEEARSQGDLLIVAVNSDASVREIKGSLRPVIHEVDRSELVAALECVDYVVLFDSATPLPLIEMLRPDVLVKGADWPLEQIVGASFVMQNGGKVVRIPVVAGISTTAIIERIAIRFGRAPQCDTATGRAEAGG